MNFDSYEIWFLAGSQHLYGSDALKQVADHARKIARALDRDQSLPIRIVYKPLVTTSSEVNRLILQANGNDHCIGLITWMHTFSPAKMWIAGIKKLQKPLLHLHTQYNRDIPWASIDMDFMNLNQSAHGGREFGHLLSRMKINRKTVVGHWQSKEVRARIAVWSRVAAGWCDLQNLQVARFGDNMREVAVTEGDKVEAQYKFGFCVNGYGVGDLVASIDRIKKKEINALVAEYSELYSVVDNLQKKGGQYASLQEAARIELGLRDFLKEREFGAFTNTFENLTGLSQLPGLAVQRLMADGYGFGAEGDWKTAALVRLFKVMAKGLPGGNSFMEDYTYHFAPDDQMVLGAHMLEICPSITQSKPSCEIHPLGIGGKADPVRLVFSADSGPALNASLIDLGDRFRLITSEVEAVKVEQDMPRLPVANVLWKPKPNLATAATAWLLAGGAHHTCFSQNITTEYLEDFAEIADIELVKIDDDTEVFSFKQALRWNEAVYG